LLKEIIEDHKATYDDNAPRDFIDAFMAEMNRNNDGYFTVSCFFEIMDILQGFKTFKSYILVVPIGMGACM